MRIHSSTLSGSLIVSQSGAIIDSGGFSGSFSGSFKGDGSNITGVTAEWDGTHTGNAVITGDFDVSGNVSSSSSTTLYLEPWSDAGDNTANLFRVGDIIPLVITPTVARPTCTPSPFTACSLPTNSKPTSFF